MKSRVKGNFQAQLAPNDFGVPLERDGELKIGIAKVNGVTRSRGIANDYVTTL